MLLDRHILALGHSRKNATTGMVASSARVEGSHAAAPPNRAMMNSRRLMPRLRSDHRQPRSLPQRGPQVLRAGTDMVGGSFAFVQVCRGRGAGENVSRFYADEVVGRRCSEFLRTVRCPASPV